MKKSILLWAVGWLIFLFGCSDYNEKNTLPECVTCNHCVGLAEYNRGKMLCVESFKNAREFSEFIDVISMDGCICKEVK
jgi:hypothetical protein